MFGSAHSGRVNGEDLQFSLILNAEWRRGHAKRLPIGFVQVALSESSAPSPARRWTGSPIPTGAARVPHRTVCWMFRGRRFAPLAGSGRPGDGVALGQDYATTLTGSGSVTSTSGHTPISNNAPPALALDDFWRLKLEEAHRRYSECREPRRISKAAAPIRGSGGARPTAAAH